MPASATGKLHQRIFNHLSLFQGKLSDDQIIIVAANIAFLVRQNCGPNTGVNEVAIPIIDGPKSTRQITLTAYDTRNQRYDIVVVAHVPVSENIVAGLSENVDKLLKDVLDTMDQRRAFLGRPIKLDNYFWRGRHGFTDNESEHEA